MTLSCLGAGDWDTEVPFMPIPTPESGEDQSKFISRCMADDVMMSEYSDQSQRAAVCHTAWKKKESTNLKIDTTEIRDVEIARCGNWQNGKVVITEKTLNEMVDNFKNKIVEPYLNLDHDDKLTDRIKDALKVVALGFVSDLRKVGDKLRADFKNVPVKIAELIKSGQLKNRSIEFFQNGYVSDGKKYNNVLKAVSFFGASIPAINGMADDFEVLLKSESHKFASGSGPETSVVHLENNQTEKGKGMNPIEISKEEYADLVAKKAQVDRLTIDLGVATKRAEDLTAELSTLKSEKEKTDVVVVTLKAEIKKQEEAAAVTLKAEAEAYVAKAIESGQILPKFRERYVASYIDSSKNKESLAMLKEDIESRTAVNLAELKFNADKKLSSSAKADDVSDDVDKANELNEVIEARMKKNGTTFEVEAAKVGLALPGVGSEE